MNEKAIFDLVEESRINFGVTCRTFSGAVTVEVLKSAFKTHKIRTSNRDVFIRGIPIEIDLVVPTIGAIAENGVLFQPEDALFALEVKKHGVCNGSKTIETVKKNFDKITHVYQGIKCCYVTLVEREGYKWRITAENIGYPAYTLFTHTGSGANRRFKSTGDWDRLTSDILRTLHA